MERVLMLAAEVVRIASLDTFNTVGSNSELCNLTTLTDAGLNDASRSSSGRDGSLASCSQTRDSSSPENSEVCARYLFNTRSQEAGETIDDFVTELRMLASCCNFQHLREGLIRDRVVVGVRSQATRESLLGQPELSLHSALHICRQAERRERGVDYSDVKSECLTTKPTPCRLTEMMMEGGEGGGLGGVWTSDAGRSSLQAASQSPRPGGWESGSLLGAGSKSARMDAGELQKQPCHSTSIPDDEQEGEFFLPVQFGTGTGSPIAEEAAEDLDTEEGTSLGGRRTSRHSVTGRKRSTPQSESCRMPEQVRHGTKEPPTASLILECSGSNGTATSIGQLQESCGSEREEPAGTELQSSGQRGAGRDSLSCDQCDERFSSVLALNIHRHSHKAKLACQVCGKLFRFKESLLTHAFSHREQVGVPFRCEPCGKNFQTQAALRRHQVSHVEGEPYVCEFCGKGFKRGYKLKVHVLVHSREKNHSCSVCGRRFSQKAYLRNHFRLHTGERPYVCKICGKRYHLDSGLIVHMRTHTGERPYTCETCGKSFLMLCHLKSHLAIHSEARPFPCSWCPKAFKRELDRKQHEKLHTREKPFVCEVCGVGFQRLEHLRRHKCTLHKALPSRQMAPSPVEGGNSGVSDS